jgi:hypothetical protein
MLCHIYLGPRISSVYSLMRSDTAVAEGVVEVMQAQMEQVGAANRRSSPRVSAGSVGMVTYDVGYR